MREESRGRGYGGGEIRRIRRADGGGGRDEDVTEEAPRASWGSLGLREVGRVTGWALWASSPVSFLVSFFLLSLFSCSLHLSFYIRLMHTRRYAVCLSTPFSAV